MAKAKRTGTDFNLTLDQIRARATEQSFARGQTYYKEGTIFDTVQRGSRIEGHCEASSQPEPYYVTAALNNEGIVETSCTCQYEYGGDCKHIVALLLTYLNKASKFEQRTPINETLADRDKDDLIALIQKMVERYPDLQALVDRPVPGRTRRQTAVDTTAFRKELRYALHEYEGWGDRTAEYTVRSIAETADEFAAKGDWRSASAIYRAILEECVSNSDYPMDDEGEFGSAVDDVVNKLAVCLAQPDLNNDDTERRALLDALLSVYIWDVGLGGYDIGADAPDYILQYARQPDLSAIRAKVKAAQQAKAGQSYGQWAAEAYAGFLIELDALDNVDIEVTLRRLREEELYSLLVRKLIELKRLDEAIAVVEAHIPEPYARLPELNYIAAAGREADAIRLAQETLRADYNSHVAGWLLEKYKAHGDWEAYLELQRRELMASPSEHNYALLKEAAEKLGRWQTIRPEILAWLRNKKHFDVLIKAYLLDEEWAAAWETFEKHGQTRPQDAEWWLYDHLDLEIAQRSQKALPQKAIPVYIKYARAHINQRDRQQYHIAAEMLATVRDLYRQTGNEAVWQKLIADIRAEFPKLRALQDELKKAGL